MWRTLQQTFPRDRDLPERAFRLQALTRVLDGSLYDGLQYGFHQETNDANEYVPLRKRRPSVRHNLCRLVVQQSVAMLFSEGHFPEVRADDETLRVTLNDLIRDTRLNAAMIDAATRGSVGSVCIWMRVLKGRIYWRVLPTVFLTPTFDPERPDELVQVRERYKVRGRDLKAQGYAIRDDARDTWHWFTRDFTADAEIWYQPVAVADDDPEAPTLKPDAQRSVQHKLGFVPMVWIRNLPGGDDVDGAPTFGDEAIETQIELEYLLSQGGRGLKYSADPLLLIKEPATDAGGQMVRSASNAIIVGEKGDAKLVEIDGAASNAVLEYAKALRQIVLESLGGNQANPEKLSAAQSGRALELLNQPLVWLADKLRISYGEDGLKRLLTLVVRASQKTALVDSAGQAIAKLSTQPFALDWPDWYSPSHEDRASQANTLRTLQDAGLMSTETAVGVLAPDYDIEDVPAELARIKAEMAERNAAAQEQVKIME